MSLDADLIVDRRRLRRSLSFWRVLSVVALTIAVLAGAAAFARRADVLPGVDHVARVAVTGFILYDRPLIRAIDRVAENDQAKALILQIDSPGGSTAGSEAIFDAIRRVAAKKPVIAVIGTVGASGAYVSALGADRIVAAQTSLVGSIGVLVQWTEFDQLMKTLGVRFQEVKTSPLKAAPNGFEPASEEAKAALNALVTDSYAWFTDLVRTRRGLDGEALKNVTDGRVFTGRQSLDLKLIDEIGDEQAAVAWLENTRNLAKKLPIRDYRPSREGVSGLLGTSLHAAFESLGLPTSILPPLVDPDARLDGLVSVWHPAVSVNR